MGKSLNPGQRGLRRGRHSRVHGVYLVTAVTDQRIPWFQVMSFARCMCRCLADPGCLPGSRNLCWVVMPDHVHLLLELLDADLSRSVKCLKATSARKLNREIGRSGRFWAPGFHDHALRKEEDLKGVGRYIVANPLRAGLVTRLSDYPYWNAVWL